MSILYLYHNAKKEKTTKKIFGFIFSETKVKCFFFIMVRTPANDKVELSSDLFPWIYVKTENNKSFMCFASKTRKC